MWKPEGPVHQKVFREDCTFMFCLYFEGSPCYDDVNTLVACRMNMAELSHNDLDMIVMGHLQQSRANSSSTMKTKHHSAKDRSRASMKYCLFGKQVCRNTFLFAFNMGIKQYKNLCKHYDENGFVPRVHGNVGKRPSNSYSVEDEKKAVDLLRILPISMQCRSREECRTR